MNKHQSINSFLREVNLPISKLDDFYIVPYEEYNNEIETSSYAYSHNFFEITLILGYNAEVKIDTKQQNISDFNLIFVSPHQKVSWQINKQYPNAKSYMLLFNPEILKRYNTYSLIRNFPFFNRYTNAMFNLNKAQLSVLNKHFDHLYEEYQHLDADSSEFISSHLSLILVYLKRQLQLSHNIFYNKSRAHQIALKFEHLLITEPIPRKTVKFYAQKLNISMVYLSECIKKATSRTFKEIVDEYSIISAKSLLKDDVVVSEVAEKLGFDESGNFAKYFKKHTGMTPKNFLKT